MRPQRNKQFDWSKPFKLVESKKEFDQIETGEDLVIAIQSKQSQVKAAEYKKENIITPRIQTVERVTGVKPFAKINPNYIRLPQRLNLPKLMDYELTEVETVFVKTHAERFKFKGKVILTQEFLSKTFIQLQLRAGKQIHVRRSKSWMDQYLDREYQDLHEWDHFESFSALVYNFWKNRRQQLKFPLLRPLWRPNPDEFNHLLAFKPREKEKRNLRKTTRISEDDILAELNDEFLLAKEITERVELRQQLRLKHVQAQLSMFHNECKNFFGMPAFFGELTHESRIKDKERIRASHQKLDKIKCRREEPLEPEIEPVFQHVYDQKLSIINFLANVAVQAEAFGINYSTIFESKPQPAIVPFSELPPVIPQQPQTVEPLLNLNLRKAGDYIIRDFETMQSQSSSQQSPHSQEITYPKRNFSDILDYKRTMVCSLYFGDDDQGDFKDLRKNIATNFKKFQAQVKQN